MQRLIFAAILCLLLICPSQICAVGLPPGTQIQLQATGQYIDVFEESQTATPATLVLTVQQAAGVSIDWDISQEKTAQGQYAYFPVRISNTGNGNDNFTLTAVSANGWAADLVYDDNNDGVHSESETWALTETSPLTTEGYCPCFLRLLVPEDATQGDAVTITAISQFNPSQGTASIDVSIPEPGLSSTKIDASATPEPATIGQMVTVSGEYHPAAAKPLDIVITSASGSTSLSVTTGSDGSFSTSFKAELVGIYEVKIDFAGDEEYDAASKTLSVTVQEKTQSAIYLNCAPETPNTDDNVTVFGTLVPSVSAAVNITCTSPTGSLTQQHFTSDSNGSFSLSKIVDKPGTWHFDATFDGDELSTPCSQSLEVQVTNASEPAHAITISQPTVTPSEVDSQGSTQCSIYAVDSNDHQLTYKWSDGGAGGSFAPSANAQTPVYTAPANNSGQDMLVTLACTAACINDPQMNNSASVELTVHTFDASAPYVVSVTPSVNAQCVSTDSVIEIRFSKTMDRASVESAVLVTPALESVGFTWSVDSKVLTISHADFALGTDYLVRLTTAAHDVNGIGMEQDYLWVFSTVVGIWFDPGNMVVETNKQFTTPPIIFDASQQTEISMSIRIPEDIELDETMAGDNLACIEIGADASSITSSWDSTTREIGITAQVVNHNFAAEVVKGITLTSPSNQDSAQLTINGCAGLILTFEPPLPGDFNSDHAVNITDAADFIAEWISWHSSAIPVWTQLTDGKFDLAPRTDGVWPYWSAIGDQDIDIQDAMAFIDCWIGSHIQNQSSSASYVPVQRCSSSIRKSANAEIAVNVDYAPNGVFEISVPLSDAVWFNPALDSNGNLNNVIKGSGSGGMVFSEYDAFTRTIRLAGSVSGLPPYAVAVIRLGR